MWLSPCYYGKWTYIAEAHTPAYKRVSCKNVWEDRNCLVKHVINGHETFFCLNCEDWVQFKTDVYNPNWTLFDEEGYLKINIWENKSNGKQMMVVNPTACNSPLLVMSVTFLLCFSISILLPCYVYMLNTDTVTKAGVLVQVLRQYRAM